MNKQIFFNITGKDEMYKTWHSSAEGMFIYFHTNGGSIVFNNAIYEIKKGVLCYISAGCYHYTMPDIPEIYTRSKLFFPVSAIKTLKSLPGFEETANEFSEKSMIYSLIPPEMQEKTKKIFEYISKSENNLFYSGVITLMSYAVNYRTDSIHSPTDSITSAISYINSHITSSVTIKQIADSVHINECYLCRKFKQVTGQTIMEYILSTRITLAKNMLKKEPFSVSEISEKCGFSSTAYFCRVFREATGKTALQYRKESC